MLRASHLRHRITIQRPVAGQDAAGQPSTTWTDVCTVWADVRYLNGLEAIRADARTGVRRASVRIRYRGDITTAMRVVHGTDRLAITTDLPDVRSGFVDLACESIK